jgi:hypothetical protein
MRGTDNYQESNSGNTQAQISSGSITGGRPSERWQACEQPAAEVQLMSIARQASQAN